MIQVMQNKTTFLTAFDAALLGLAHLNGLVSSARCEFGPDFLPVVRSQIPKTAFRVLCVDLLRKSRACNAYSASDLVDVLLVYFEPFSHLFALFRREVWDCHGPYPSVTLSNSQAFRYGIANFICSNARYD